MCSLFRYLDANRIGQTGTLQLLHLRGHCRREEVGRTLSRNDFEDFVDDRAEVHIQQSVGFVHDLRMREGCTTRDVGSIRTKNFRPRRLKPLVFSRWSFKRPGVATTM